MVSRIEKIRLNKQLPTVLINIRKDRGLNFEAAKNAYLQQVEQRLAVRKEAYVPQDINAHELESRINNTLKFLCNKSLDKFNDELESHLPQKEKSYVRMLFARIYLARKFQPDNWKIYDVAYKQRRRS